MQCAAIPNRKMSAGDLEVLLVTSRSKGNWILPKGNVKSRKTAAVSAQEEVCEEAGVRGTIDQALVARCDLPLIAVGEGAAVEQMQILSMEVSVVAATWAKMLQRQRRWVSLQEVKRAHFRAALRRFASIMAPIA